MSRRGAFNGRDNTASQNMFLNIFFVHHNSTAAGNFVSRMDAHRVPKGVPTMLRKTMIVLAKAAAALLWTLEQGLGLR